MKTRHKEIAGTIGLSIIIFSMLASFIYYERDLNKHNKCYHKCILFDCKLWEYKGECECFKDNKVIKLEDLINNIE